MQGLVWLEVLNLRRSGTLTYIMSKSLQLKYRSRSPGHGICRVSTLRRSTLQGLMVSSSSWGLGRAAFCDCGTPWTFLLPFL